MSSYLRIDVSAGRFTLDVEIQSGEEVFVGSLINTENPGDLEISMSNGKPSISSDITGKHYIKDYPLPTSYKIKELGSNEWSVVNSNGLLQTIQGVLDRPSAVVVSDDSYVISDFIKPDLTSGHSETTEFVHNGDIDNGGAVILDSNSALIGFQSGTFVKTTENIVGGRPYGRVQMAVDDGTGSGTPISAIDIVQGNVKQYPDITVNGDVVFDQKVILTSPNGTQYRLGVDNSGNLSTQAV